MNTEAPQESARVLAAQQEVNRVMLSVQVIIAANPGIDAANVTFDKRAEGRWLLENAFVDDVELLVRVGPEESGGKVFVRALDANDDICVDVSLAHECLTEALVGGWISAALTGSHNEIEAAEKAAFSITPAERDEAIEEVVEHVLGMQKQYGFQNDLDSVAGAIRESADLLSIDLNDADVAVASTRALERGPEHLREHA